MIYCFVYAYEQLFISFVTYIQNTDNYYMNLCTVYSNHIKIIKKYLVLKFLILKSAFWDKIC